MKSLLYHGFGISGYRYLATEYLKGEIYFKIEPEDDPKAPEGQRLIRKGFRWRMVRTLGIGMKPVWLKVKVQRWKNTVTNEEFEQSPPLPTPTQKSLVPWRD
jgi:hypothetical protein